MNGIYVRRAPLHLELAVLDLLTTKSWILMIVHRSGMLMLPFLFLSHSSTWLKRTKLLGRFRRCSFGVTYTHPKSPFFRYHHLRLYPIDGFIFRSLRVVLVFVNARGQALPYLGSADRLCLAFVADLLATVYTHTRLQRGSRQSVLISARL